MRYLVLPRITVQNANAHAASWVVNATPVMAATMFAHNLGRTLDEQPEGIAFFHHDAQILADRIDNKILPHQRRGATLINKNDYVGSTMSLSMQPVVTCHLTISLVLAFADDAFFSIDEVEIFLKSGRGRLAGGQITNWQKVKVVDTEEKVRSLLRSGFWLIDRTDLLSESTDPLDTLIKTVTKITPKQKKEVEEETNEEGVDDEVQVPQENQDDNEEHSDSWIVPTVLGYATISDFAERQNVRSDGETGETYQHAFAEPLVGLVQYLSARRFKDKPIPFWSHQWISNDCFTLTQQKGD